MDFKKLNAHFQDYWNQKGVKNMSIPNPINRDELGKTAAEVPPLSTAPQKGKEQSPVLESVEDLGGTVQNEVGKKMDLQVRRVIEDAVRRYLGPLFQQLEQAIKPQVEKEVQEQSTEVKQDIKDVVPAIAKAQETVEPAPAPVKAPKEPPKEAPIKEAASLEKKAAGQSKIEISKEIPAFDIISFEEHFGARVVPDPVSGRISIIADTDRIVPITDWLKTQDADWTITEMGSEISPITQEIPLTDVRPVEVLASLDKTAEDRMLVWIEQRMEAIKSADPYISNEAAREMAEQDMDELKKVNPSLFVESNLNTPREEIRVSGKEEETDMLKIAYHQGETFDKSYFVATDGKVVKAVSAIRVIPADVQAAIKSAEEKGEEAQDILSPEEAAVEIEKSSKGTMEGFVEFTQSLPKLTREADLKRESEWAINEGEIAKVEMPRKGEVIMSVKEDEKEETDLPSGRSSKVKQYYGRLPSQGVGPQEIAINQQSSVNDKYKLVVQALEQEKEKVKTLSTDLGKKDEELGKLKEEKSVGQKKSSVSSIMGALKKLGPVDPETEKTAVDMLVKVDEKALAVVLDVLKLVGGEKEDGKGEMPMFGGAPKLEGPKGPAAPKPMMPPMKASINGINLPQTGVSTETTSLMDVVSKMMDH
jgi:hypothetical protein